MTGALRPGSAGAAVKPVRRDVVLSDEWKVTRFATPAQLSAIRTRPDPRARRVASLHWLTEDGFSELYLLLRAHWDARGRQWVQLRIPMRPNGRVGWVPRSALGRFGVTHEALVVDRRRLRMTFLVHGRVRWSAPVGVGAPGTPTPPGRFWIRERFAIADPTSGYWPWAFGTSDYSTLTDWPGGGIVGIHGPYYADGLIPGDISHGCIRLHARDDGWLGLHLTLGAPLRIV